MSDNSMARSVALLDSVVDLSKRLIPTLAPSIAWAHRPWPHVEPVLRAVDRTGPKIDALLESRTARDARAVEILRRPDMTLPLMLEIERGRSVSMKEVAESRRRHAEDGAGG
jgi:hypothetical protein